ncbi:MAG: GguC family protein [Collimonas sp.]
MLLVQFRQADGRRRIGALEDDGRKIRIVEGYDSTYDLAQTAIAGNSSLQSLAGAGLGNVVVDYAEVAQTGRLLPPLDHSDSAHCYVTGTGLTHLGSADGRDAMHKKISDVDTLTDSMKMFRMGLDGGKPQPGQAGVQPEWFYKGDGSIVCAGEQPLTMPHFALDGGEEPEIAALYVIAADGTPCRLGFAIGNEFSDHVTERQNYLYLAHSKLRVCAVGPALLLGDLPPHVEGMSRIRGVNGQVRWEKPFVSGEENMSHTVANLEYHHFKYPLFRRPGDVHIHFFGTATLSCSDGIQVAPGETFEIDVAAFGPPLRNQLAVATLAAPQIRPL